MSVQALSWVFDHSPTRGADRLVLLSLANHAGTSPVNGAYESWPGVKTIAQEAGLDRTRTVRDALSRLVKDGHVERIINGAPDRRCRPDRRPNLYRIILNSAREDAERPPVDIHSGRTHDDPPRTLRGDARRHNGGTRGDQTGGRDASPKPSMNRQRNHPPYLTRAELSASPVDKSEGEGDLVEQAIQLAAKQYARNESTAGHVRNPDGLARWWFNRHGDTARARATHLLEQDQSLSLAQLRDRLLVDIGRTATTPVDHPTTDPVSQPEGSTHEHR